MKQVIIEFDKCPECPFCKIEFGYFCKKQGLRGVPDKKIDLDCPLPDIAPEIARLREEFGRVSFAFSDGRKDRYLAIARGEWPDAR